jgi:hypothetical protein
MTSQQQSHELFRQNWPFHVSAPHQTGAKNSTQTRLKPDKPKRITAGTHIVGEAGGVILATWSMSVRAHREPPYRSSRLTMTHRTFGTPDSSADSRWLELGEHRLQRLLVRPDPWAGLGRLLEHVKELR